MKNNRTYHCGIEATLDLIGGKWKALILWRLLEKPLRFNELCRQIPHVSPKGSRLVDRKAFPVVPPKVEYSLTSFGRSLLPILEVMCAWGNEYLKQIDPADAPHRENHGQDLEKPFHN